ncbi:amino acid synthesis family protein [Cochlodiniinecator piscidefendens]|uniref:amino acid synthesis family protein n=1 Tax=Cochlodiniinecator piscidefendens TaxID=2715756 RepID=UPI00140CE72A|nr:amino acid synthesis family protein [Cochlodiniinecator piscidefendens]
MPAEIRKTLLHVEDNLIEGGKVAETPLKMIAAMAVITNPWAGMGFVNDLRPKILECAPGLGQLLTDMVLDAAGGGDKVEGYGKSAIVGVNGEIEHGSALIHTLQFGNFYRNAVGAKSYLSFTNTRGPANASIQIPLMDKNDGGKRSHYLTIQTQIADAPAPDEIVIALGASIGGRPHHRIGDRYQDLKELGHDVDNPAAV